MQQEVVNTAYSYSDITLIPNKGILKTRSNADVSIKLGQKTFSLPVVPSNMKCTIDMNLAKTLADKGYFYIMHRFDNNKFFITNAVEKNHYISISVGVKQEDVSLVKCIKEIGYDISFITIDIAHGHSEDCIRMIGYIKENLPSTFLIAGNIATAKAALDLKNAGADAVKVGIGQGNACTTKDKTGFTVPMFTCVRNIFRENIGIPIIADGGIRSNGDIAKAIAAGADMVMCGSLFAECSDSPADVFEDENGQTYKLYFGSASIHNKVENVHIEGTLKRVPHNTMTYTEKLEEIRQDLSSAISYSGGTRLNDLRKVDFYALR